jgi:hypothetical protein
MRRGPWAKMGRDFQGGLWAIEGAWVRCAREDGEGSEDVEGGGWPGHGQHAMGRGRSIGKATEEI